MDVKTAIDERRAFRSLEQVTIADHTVRELARAASLTPSCFNNQPWTFVFVRMPECLKALHGALGKNNEWMTAASMIIAVCSEKKRDCIIKEREYSLFDTGMATAFLILQATEMGLVAHPIAGYDPEKAKSALEIPAGYNLITLVAIGKHSKQRNPLLTDKQWEAEAKRPDRLPLGKIAFVDKFGAPLE